MHDPPVDGRRRVAEQRPEGHGEQGSGRNLLSMLILTVANGPWGSLETRRRTGMNGLFRISLQLRHRLRILHEESPPYNFGAAGFDAPVLAVS